MFRSSSSYGDISMYHPASFSAALPTAPTQIPCVGYVDGNSGCSFPPFAAVAGGASSPPSYSSSLPSSYYIHRSISSHSLPLHFQVPDAVHPNAFFSPTHQLPLPPLSSSPSSSSGDFLEFSSGPVRRVFSTGDLQGMNRSPPPLPSSGDNYGQEGGGAHSQKVGRYSAEERKERIERYRIKRHQRNFNKKITYACRKTLADSRPRVKGRFARNGETEADGEAELDREASDNGSYECWNYHDHGNSNSSSSSNYYHHGQRDSIALGSDNGEWWRRTTPAAASAAAGDDSDHLIFCDDDLWASLADVLSVNLAS